MNMSTKSFGLKQQILLAAAELSGGDLQKTMTAEELLVSAWKKDRHAWGLRGFEDFFPDSSKLFKELDAHAGKQGIVGDGLLEKVHRRVFRLTPTGLAEASALRPTDAITREKADRQLEQAVKQIIEHPVFRDWLKDPTRPKYFREAGHFWGIAPGTPPKTVLERVSLVERTLSSALKALNERGVNELIEQRGKVLFERKDIERCLEFQRVLTERFKRDLALLAPGFGA
jgi:DNA-binding transcriptional ArsR family regulator